jgi:hypothetical protein
VRFLVADRRDQAPVDAAHVFGLDEVRPQRRQLRADALDERGRIDRREARGVPVVAVDQALQGPVLADALEEGLRRLEDAALVHRRDEPGIFDRFADVEHHLERGKETAREREARRLDERVVELAARHALEHVRGRGSRREALDLDVLHGRREQQVFGHRFLEHAHAALRAEVLQRFRPRPLDGAPHHLVLGREVGRAPGEAAGEVEMARERRGREVRLSVAQQPVDARGVVDQHERRLCAELAREERDQVVFESGRQPCASSK